MFNRKTIKTIGIVLLFLVLIVALLNSFLDNYKLEKEHKYTIGIVKSTRVNARLGESVHFSIFIKGVKYEISEIIYIKMYGYTPNNIISKRFLVKYQPSNPENCKLMLDYRARDGVKAPPDGWDSIPIRK
jgi:hypothetical protein